MNYVAYHKHSEIWSIDNIEYNLCIVRKSSFLSGASAVRNVSRKPRYSQKLHVKYALCNLACPCM